MAISIALHKVHSRPTFYDVRVRNVISEKKLKEIISVVSERYEFLDLNNFIKLYTKRNDIALLTFDDGNSSVFTNAFPILKKMQIPFVIFVNTYNINTKKPHWFEVLESAFLLSTVKRIKIKDKYYSLKNTDEKISSLQVIKGNIKRSNVDLNAVIKMLNVRISDAVSSAKKFDSQLSLSQLKSLLDYGVSIGSHGYNHTILSGLSKQDQQKNISISKKWIEARFNDYCSAFSYPNGGKRDFNEYTINALKSEGFSCAFSAEDKKITRMSDKYKLPRYFVWEDRGLNFIK